MNMQVPAKKGAAYARWISIFFGIFSFAFVFVVERLGGVLEVILFDYKIHKIIYKLLQSIVAKNFSIMVKI